MPHERRYKDGEKTSSRWGRVFANHTPDKGVAVKFIQIIERARTAHPVKTTSPAGKWAKDMDTLPNQTDRRHRSAHENIQRHQPLGKQVKTRQFRRTAMVKLNVKISAASNPGENSLGMQDGGAATPEKTLAVVSDKTKDTITTRTSNHALGHLSQEMKTCLHKNLYRNMYRSFIVITKN